MEQLINKLEQKRKDFRFSQEKFADEIGMTKNGYQYILKEKDLKVSLLKKISEVLEVPVSYFFDGVEETNSFSIKHNNGNVANGNIIINGETTNKIALEEKIRNYENQIRDKNKIISLLENDIEEMKLKLKK